MDDWIVTRQSMTRFKIIKPTRSPTRLYSRLISSSPRGLAQVRQSGRHRLRTRTRNSPLADQHLYGDLLSISRLLRLQLSVPLLVALILKPVPYLELCHFQGPGQQCPLVSTEVLLTRKHILEVLQLQLREMTANSLFLWRPIPAICCVLGRWPSRGCSLYVKHLPLNTLVPRSLS